MWLKKSKCIINTVLLTMIGVLLLYYTNSSHKTLKYWVQPDTVQYGEFRYRLSVVETTRVPNLLFMPLYHHEIFISKQSVKPELDMMYGHYKEYGFEGEQENIKELLSQCQVRWEENGVWFIEPDGHKLFFPKSTFMGGR